MEADHNIQQWKEQADEARTELVKSKSNAKVLQAELENTLKELAQARGETLNQGGLASSSKQQAEVGKFERSAAISLDAGCSVTLTPSPPNQSRRKA
jgi:hypothetical protein